MANLVSAWEESRRIVMVERDGDTVRFRAVPAKWSMFVTGLDVDDRRDIGRDPRVSGVSVDGRYTRVDCVDRMGRRGVRDALEAAARDARGVYVLEADVSPIRRLLSDVSSLNVHPDPRLGYFDLETDSRATFPEMRAGKARILSWAVCGDDGAVQSAVLERDTDAAEVELLMSFFDAVDRYDCLLAWNGSGFDFDVLQNRCDRLDVGRPGDRPILWHRWTWLDHLEVFKRYNVHSDDSGVAKQSFRLNHVAHYLLGEGKHDFDASRTWEAWAAGGEERERLLRYNEQDAQLLPRIEEKTGFLALHLAVCHVCRIFPDTDSLHATAQGDGFLLHLGAQHGYRWRSKRREDGEQTRAFKGAYVMEPTRTGSIEDVHVADFSGLYPSIMRTWNMSPDTKVRGHRYADLESRWRTSGKPALEPDSCQLPNRATWFRTDRDGMFRIALNDLVAKRGEYTAEMKKHTPGTPEHARFKLLSGAFKIVANSFYGICGSPYSRFFDVDIAEGVTQTGRWLLEQVIEESARAGLDPFYGDTDSVFVSGDVEEFKGVVRRMNDSWSDRLYPWGINGEHHVDLDFEKTFKRIVIVSAKRYAGRYRMYKGKEAKRGAAPEVKGLEYKRGDTIAMARSMQREVVGELLDGEDLPDPASIRPIVQRWRRQVLEGPLTLEDVTMSQSLSKRIEEYADRYASSRCIAKGCNHDFGSDSIRGGDKKCPKCGVERAFTSVPTHVRVAKIMRDRGGAVEEGARVSYVVVGSEGKIDAVPASDPDALERADRVYYWERRVYPATSRVLEKVYPGEEWGESKAERRQRVQEMNGQAHLDFDAPTEAPAKPEGRPKMRRRRKPPLRTNGAEIVATLVENNAVEDGAGEKYRRKHVLEAVMAAIEANPGDTPVKLEIAWRSATEPGKGRRIKVVMDTGLKMARTPRARAALERVMVPGAVRGF